MPNRTLYINNSNWEKFKDEPSMSAVVNALLIQHYAKFDEGDLKHLRTITKRSLKKYPNAVKEMEEVEQATPAEIFEGRTCKAGHPSKDGKYCMNIKCSYFNG